MELWRPSTNWPSAALQLLMEYFLGVRLQSVKNIGDLRGKKKFKSWNIFKISIKIRRNCKLQRPAKNIKLLFKMNVQITSKWADFVRYMILYPYCFNLHDILSNWSSPPFGRKTKGASFSIGNVNDQTILLENVRP